LEEARDRVATRIRALRHERGWTQAQLGERLGLSQARLSEVERGGGSFTAEQLLAVLELFNVPISEFLPKTDPEDALQNALIQLGAAHLRQVPGVAPDGRYPGAEDVVQATLLGSRAPRLVTALAPVLLHQVESIALPRLRARLAEVGREPRLGWLLDNVRLALEHPFPSADAPWRRRAARASVWIADELSRFPAPPGDGPLDFFDPTIRSEATRALVWEDRASPVSRRWRLVSDLQPDDFRQALWSADGVG
jgi:transcriptional regulator with XRE-family HTH domain